MKIVVDVDDVVLDMTGRYTAMFREWFDLEPIMPETWDMPLGQPIFDNKAEFFAWFEEAGGWRDMHYVPGAPGGIYELLDLGFRPHFVTGRSGAAAKAAYAWWFNTPWRDDTFLDTNQFNKASVKAKLYVDDNPAFLTPARQLGRGVILFDRPWNQGAFQPRAKSWRQVVEIAKAFKERGFQVEGD